MVCLKSIKDVKKDERMDSNMLSVYTWNLESSLSLYFHMFKY